MNNPRIDRIIVEGEGLTSDERDDVFIKRLEKALNTGPIIGEAHNILRQLSRNLMIRDVMLSAMGMDVQKREESFKEVNRLLRKQDEKILAERKENKKAGQ